MHRNFYKIWKKRKRKKSETNVGFWLLHVSFFIDHKIIWIYKVQYAYFKKMAIFAELWKVDLGAFVKQTLQIYIPSKNSF